MVFEDILVAKDVAEDLCRLGCYGCVGYGYDDAPEPMGYGMGEGPRDRGERLAAASGHGEAVKALRHGGGFAAGVENGGPKGVDGRRAGRGGEGVHVAAEPLGELGHGLAFAPEGETLGLHETLGVEVVGVDEA